MKVLYARTKLLAGLQAGGSVAHTAGVVRSLHRLAETRIVSSEPIYGAGEVPCRLVPPRFRRPHAAAECLHNPRFAAALGGEIHRFRPDFVYHRHSGLSYAVAATCRRLGVAMVLEFNSSEVWQLRYWWAPSGPWQRLKTGVCRSVVARVEPYNLRSASLVVVVSAALRDSLVAQGWPGEKILVNPNGVDAEKFSPAPPRTCARLRRQLGIGAGRVVVGFCGTFGAWHGVQELQEAIRRINADERRRGELFFVLYGDGKLRPACEERIGGFDNVRFTGTVPYERIQDYLSICDVLVSPHGRTADGREFFGSPTKLFEYMAMGKGIVASDLGQIGEVLEDGKTALLVRPGDVSALADGIVRLAGDAALRSALGRAARKTALREHTWERNVRRTLEAFRRRAGGPT